MKQWILLLSVMVAFGVGTVSSVARAGCTGGPDVAVTTVSRTFSAGSAISVGINRSPCEGLVLTNINFKPAGGTSTKVLHRASLAEVHVPYDNNAARFLDVTFDTSGLGANAVALSAAECEGTLHDGNRICVQNHDGGYAWKFNTSFRERQAVEIFMASQLGQYTYINKWTFKDDGTIEPEVGLTGRLQITSTSASNADFGSRVNAQSAATPIYAINHMHNFYYRLDFDIAGPGSDAVSRITYTPTTAPAGCSTSGQCGRTVFSQILTETEQSWSTTGQTSWFIWDKSVVNADGRNIGYELSPHVSGLWNGMTSTTEPWAASELWVTAYNFCEMFAARNQSPYLNPAGNCGTPAAHVSAMVNAQPVDGADVVVWYANRHHHVTRDEDQTNMPIEWAGFHLKPRSFSASNPAP